MIRAGRIAFLALVPVFALLVSGCRAERWFEEGVADAAQLPTGSIAAFLFAGGFISEDLTCISAGVLVAKRSVSFLVAVLACTLGVWASDSLLYFWGFLGRRGLLDRPPLSWIAKRERIDLVTRQFARHGVKLLLFSRFMPGSRVPIYLAAGLLAYPYRKFAAWMGLAAALWAPAMVALSLWLGDLLLVWLDAYESIAWIAVPAAIALVWGVLRAIEALVGKWGARPLAGDLDSSGDRPVEPE